MRTRLESDFAQLITILESTFSENLYAAGDDYFLYSTVLEPSFPHSLETVREAEHLRILLVESKLFGRHLHLRRDFQVFNFRSPETQLPELLDVFVQLKTLECTAGSKRGNTYFL